MSFKESQYDWAHVPVNLPKENLVLVVAKTTTPTNHLNDWDHSIRCFTEKELSERGASLALRPIGLNHIKGEAGLIVLDSGLAALTGHKTAFTVDAQYNKSTESLEALLFLPKMYIEMIRDGKITKPSVEFISRDEHKVGEKLYFEGITFYRIDLLYGLSAGDPDAGDFQFVESAEAQPITVHFMEANFGLASSPDPTVAAHDAMNQNNQMNMKAFNVGINQPLVDNLYFECPKCGSKYECNKESKEWKPFVECKECTEAEKVTYEAKLVEMKTALETTAKELETAKKTLTDNHTAIENLQALNTQASKERKEAVDKAITDTKKVISEKITKLLPDRKFGWDEPELASVVNGIKRVIE